MTTVPSTTQTRDNAPPDGGDALRPGRVLLLGLFVFAAMVFTTYLDLERFPILGSDEIGHLNTGLHDMSASDVWNIYSMPLHSLTYAISGLFEADPVRIYRLNAFVPFFLMVFLLQMHILRATGSMTLALLAAAPLLLSTEMGVLAWPHANQTVCIILLLGLLAAPRAPSYGAVVLHFTLLFFILGFARSEQILVLYYALAVIGGVALLRLLRRRDIRDWTGTFGFPILMTGAVIGALSVVMGVPVLLDKYRSLAAFSQHFAYGLSLRSDIAEHPWLEADPVFERHFGDATSISSSLLANPGAFFEHVFFNLSHFLSWAFTSDPVGAGGWVIALALYLSAAALFLRRHVRALRSGSDGPEDFRRLVCLAIPIPSLILVALIFPRPNYLQMGYVVMVATAPLLLYRPVFPAWPGRRVVSGLPVLLAALVLALIHPVPERPDPHAAVVGLIEDAAVRQGLSPVRIATTHGLCAFLTGPCESRRISHTEAALMDSLRRDDLDFVVLAKHPERPDLQEDLDPALADIGDGWTALPTPEGWHVLRRRPIPPE